MNYSKLVSRIRNKVFDYPPEMDEKVTRVLRKCVAKKIEQRDKAAGPEPKGPYSGLTRRELALTGTCETDWY